ncbi:uncharacterized protein LOC123544844 isoform X1 [Mercenaria mercenaria]|uniref:uncharacterized protein LOC123544844 isoform X1 n=1 Tax=Mercenaria mercenaria TaxID=6596 RepID=UPI00234FB00F|nr:uncharacterized protein LOC123544844 isoform X1 [Mercenaria mercenaria]
MDKINSPGTPKITCTYLDLYTEKQFQCRAIQKCCGSRCCDDENLDTYLIWGGVVLLVLVLLISVCCWYIMNGRKRSRDILGTQKQRVSNMLSANQNPNECIVTIQVDDVEKSKSTKTALLPRNFSSISFTESLFKLPNSKIEKCIAGSHDQQPLLDDFHWDGNPKSVTSESHMNT